MRNPSEDGPFPSVPQAAMLLLAAFLLRYVVNTAFYDLRRTLGLSAEQLATIGVVVSDGILISAVMYAQAMSYRSLLHPSKTSALATATLLVPPVLLLIPLLVLLDFALVSALEAVFPLSSWEQTAFDQMFDIALPSVIAVCVVAPVVEEILFRGILLRGFLRRYPPGAAICLSALLFGAAHLNIYQFFLAFLLGLPLGWLYERSRSLIPCIALHAAINTAATLWGSATAEPAIGSALSHVPLLAWVAAAASAAVGALALRRLLTRRAAHQTVIDPTLS